MTSLAGRSGLAPTGDAVLLTPVTPAASGNGLAMRAGLFLRGLARSFRVRCIVVPVFGGPGTSDGLVERLGANVEVVRLDASVDPVADLSARLAEPAWRARATAVHPRPALCGAATVDAARAVARAVGAADLVHVHRLYLMPFLDAVLDDPRSGSSPPLVTVDVDDLDAAVLGRLGDEAEAAAYDRLAYSYLPATDRTFTASQSDAVTLTARGFREVFAVPNAVDLPPVLSARAADHDLLFVGSMSYAPNAAAARWLCEEVLPHLPGARAAVVGSDPHGDVASLHDIAGVTVTGAVPDVTPWYGRSRVAVVPVHDGGGTRIKLLEALAHGRPVVATTVGAEGLDLVAGRDGLLVADTPADFAMQCRRLLDDPALAVRLAAAGRDAVERTATVERVAAHLDEQFCALQSELSRPRAIPERIAVLGSQLHRNRVAAEVCTALSDEGVRAVLLKGASFATWLYDSPLERVSSDVDILVAPAAEAAAGATLERLGFRTVHGKSDAMLLGHPAVEWVRGVDWVDLHRGRFWGVTVPADRAWSVLAARATPMDVGGVVVDVLDEPARALNLVLHVAASGPSATRPRRDLDRAFARLPSDVWKEAAQLAQDLGADAARFATGLALAPAGAALAHELGVDDPAGWDRLALVDATLRANGAPRFATGLARLLAEPGLGTRVATLARIVAPTPTYLAQHIPWARRSATHLVRAYVVWFGVLLRGAAPAIGALVRAWLRTVASRRDPHRNARES